MLITLCQPFYSQPDIYVVSALTAAPEEGGYIVPISQVRKLRPRRSVQKVSSHVGWKRDIYWRRYGIQETVDIGQWLLGYLQHRHLGTSYCPPYVISCSVMFSWISLMIWNQFPFKGDFSFRKSQKLQGTKYGLWGGWVTWVILCFGKNCRKTA